MKRNKLRIIALAMAAILLTVVPALLGCSSASNESVTEMVADSYYSDYDSMYDYGYDVGYTTDTAVEEPMTAEMGDSASGSTVEAELERKIIRNADVDIEAENANDCYAAVLEYVKTLGGYESNYNASTSDYSSGTYVYLDAEFRLPPEKLEMFVAELKTGDYGEITYCSVTSDEVTEEYYDLATRLDSKERALESYYQLLEKAESIDDVLSIQGRIDDLTEEIESIKGKLRLYDSLVDESTVYLSITQYTEKPVAEKEFEWDSLTGSDFLKLIKNGFLGVCNFVWSALQWIVIIVISLSPVLIIAGVVLFVVLKIRKKNAMNKPAKETAVKADNVKNDVDKISAPDYK